MSLRSRPATSYYLQCDRVGCSHTSPPGLAPFEAEAVAEANGWARDWSHRPPLNFCPEHRATVEPVPTPELALE